MITLSMRDAADASRLSMIYSLLAAGAAARRAPSSDPVALRTVEKVGLPRVVALDDIVRGWRFSQFSEHAVRIRRRLWDSLQHVPVFDDLALVIEFENIDASPITVSGPVLEAVQDDVMIVRQHSPELNAFPRVGGEGAIRDRSTSGTRVAALPEIPREPTRPSVAKE